MGTQRQFVQVGFRDGGRLYTYHHDYDPDAGEAPLAKGEIVRVDGRDGWQDLPARHVFAGPAPNFATKPVARAPRRDEKTDAA